LVVLGSARQDGDEKTGQDKDEGKKGTMQGNRHRAKIPILSRNVKRVSFLVIVAGFLAGCGGASGGVTAPESIRLLAAGDSWTYLVTGNATKSFPDGSGVSGNFNGTMVRTVLPTTLTDDKGNACQVLDENWNISIETLGAQLLGFQQCFTQAIDGTIFLHGNSDPVRGKADNPVNRFVADPASGSFLLLKSPVAVEDTFTLGPATFDDATTLQGIYTVPSAEVLPLAIATFQTFRMETFTQQVSGGTTFTIQVIRWMVPRLGTEVREEGAIIKQDENTDTLIFTAVLTETSVPF
jgi:hypothetical protein